MVHRSSFGRLSGQIGLPIRVRAALNGRSTTAQRERFGPAGGYPCHAGSRRPLAQRPYLRPEPDKGRSDARRVVVWRLGLAGFGST